MGAQDVVFCVVDRGGFVVNSWWKHRLNRARKFATFAEFIFGRTCRVIMEAWGFFVGGRGCAQGEVEKRISPLRCSRGGCEQLRSK